VTSTRAVCPAQMKSRHVNTNPPTPPLLKGGEGGFPTAIRFQTVPPLSLYVHLPWCVRKCPYCDFNSYEAGSGIPERDYVDALLRDLDGELAFSQGRSLQSIFIGGGTPSLFSGEEIARLIGGIRARINVCADAEITLEANPGTAEANHFAGYRVAGVNRLSIGIQSLRDHQLARLGRIHTSAEAVRAFEMARAARFEDINLDLMYGLPGDDAQGALADLEQAVELGPPHVSWYQLTIEPNTAFHRAPPPLPDEDTVIAIEEEGRALFTAHGYEHYEVSAHAKTGHRCVHNLNYWQFGDYLGIGAGAHGKVTDRANGCILRRAKERKPVTYMRTVGTGAATTTETIIDPSQVAVEFMMNALRLTEGVPLALFIERTGLRLQSIDAALTAAAARSLLCIDEQRISPTPLGQRFLNDLITLFDSDRLVDLSCFAERTSNIPFPFTEEG